MLNNKQMINKLIYLLLVIIIFQGCEKESEQVAVKYLVNKAYSETEITYYDENKILHTKTVDFESSEDEWEYSFEGIKGDILYVSTVYYDSTSSVDVKIFLDGKIYKQGSSNNEPDKYVTVSGTIPY